MYSLGYMCSSPISSMAPRVNPNNSGLFPRRLPPATIPPQLLRRQTPSLPPVPPVPPDCRSLLMSTMTYVRASPTTSPSSLSDSIVSVCDASPVEPL
ncbi:hypothetical protein AALP_AA4G114600 [Arabis alpina]|uniref:Uncharacterized protein n=1 Tax=Arabis alpina TaxID=50452 RepID=A0A087H2L8_ARAAL|nr:hypothetical protein AALP_AA4G114600 [Arabis alpina]